MNCNHWWQRPVLLASLLLCGASLGIHRTQAAPSANLDQTRNGKFDDIPANLVVGIDVNGNAGFQNSHYLEGHGIPYRCVMSDLPRRTQITIRLGFDIKHSDRNALDYLTGFQLLDPHTQFGHPAEAVNPTVGTSLAQTTPTPDSEIDFDTPKASIPANSFAKLPTQTLRDGSKKKMSLWGGTLNSIKYVDDGASWTNKLGQSTSQILIDVTFTTGNGTVAILSWAGHIASRADWGIDAKGVPNSAGGIDGSPYHMALISWTLSNIGQQDRSLKADAVIIPPSCNVTGDTECVGGPATLTVAATTEFGGFGGPYTFAWSRTLNPDGTLGTVISTSPTLTFDQVKLTDSGTCYAQVKDSKNVSSIPCNGTLAVKSPPTVSVNSAPTCEGTAVDVKVTASATAPATITNYKWTVPAGATDPGNVAICNTKVAGDYSVEVTDSNGCKFSGRGTVTVNALPKVTVTSPPACDGTDAEVKASVTPQDGATTYKWTVPTGANDPGNTNRFKTKVAGKYKVDVTDSNGCRNANDCNVTFISPAIACGPEACAAGAGLILFHRLDGDAQGGAAIVNDSAVALETFPSGSDISYEPFDKFAVLGLAPGQVTTTQIEIPICNKGAVPLENVHLTFYKGNTALEKSPTDCVTVPDGAPFDGTLGVGQNVTLQTTVQVQCGTVPITVSGTTSAANYGCPAESSCSVVVECVEVFCRTTGGGRQDPGLTTHLQTKSGNTLVDDTSVKFTTHGGQMRGRQTIPLLAADINSISGSPNICGQWQHVRHANNGRLQSFHTAGIFDSLRCACLACDSLTPLSNGGLCNPEDRVCGPEPRRANANAIAVTGVGKMALKPGQKDTDVVFRIYIEDRGEPGGSPFGHPEDPPDVYCLQIWVVNPPTSGALRASISGWLGSGIPAGAPVPDISDCGDLSRGNHQLHPVKNLNCP